MQPTVGATEGDELCCCTGQFEVYDAHGVVVVFESLDDSACRDALRLIKRRERTGDTPLCDWWVGRNAVVSRQLRRLRIVHPQCHRAGSTDDLDTTVTVLDEQPRRALDRLQFLGSVNARDEHRINVCAPATGKVGDGLESVGEPVQVGDAYPAERVGEVVFAFLVPLCPGGLKCRLRGISDGRHGVRIPSWDPRSSPVTVRRGSTAGWIPASCRQALGRDARRRDSLARGALL